MNYKKSSSNIRILWSKVKGIRPCIHKKNVPYLNKDMPQRDGNVFLKGTINIKAGSVYEKKNDI